MRVEVLRSNLHHIHLTHIPCNSQPIQAVGPVVVISAGIVVVISDGTVVVISAATVIVTSAGTVVCSAISAVVASEEGVVVEVVEAGVEKGAKSTINFYHPSASPIPYSIQDANSNSLNSLIFAELQLEIDSITVDCVLNLS